MSLPALGLLVALISIISLSLPIALKLVTPDNSDVRVEFQNFEDGTAYFVASNLGSRPGTVTEAYFDFKGELRRGRYNLIGDAQKQFIEPGASRQLSFAIPCADEKSSQIQYKRSEKFGSRPLADNAQLNVVILQFDGSKHTKFIKIDQLSSLRALNDKGYECLQAKLRAAEAR